MKDLESVFEAFQGLKVLIIGDVMVDAYIWGKVERISPEAPVPVLHARRREKRLGGAANVALNIQAMGAVPILCSAIGNDDNGVVFERLLEEQGITGKGIIKSDQRVTTTKERLLAGSQQMLRVDSEEDEPLTESDKEKLLSVIAKLIPESHVIIFQDYDKGVLDESLIQKVITLGYQHKVPTVVDPKKRNFHHYKQATLFKPNLKELKEGLNLDGKLLQGTDGTITKVETGIIENASDQLRKIMQVHNTMITLSAKGVFIDANYYNDKREKHFLPAHFRQIADVSGAGDTVISIAALCLALNLPPRITAELANLGGGLVCEYMGVVPVDKKNLLAEARKHGLLQ